MSAICGLDCAQCGFRDQCEGCAETGGKPFGGSCVLAACCLEKGCENCGKVFEAPCRLKEELVREFNALGIGDMEEVRDLNALVGSYINLEYTLPRGQKIKLWDDSRVYLGNQLCKKDGSGRCYGLTADENYLLVCEYGENGSDPEIVVYRRRRKACGLPNVEKWGGTEVKE
ncbi:MAG TPA: DUF3795 domain-containing protein [Candidatus Merdivicinus excrementipullorum]|uniref:DUF3795 domain-containing protein n=1 Tax=Candidatus Merdivicinus excrementipullorum TaxID=2840867 RepID=A0A9D1FL56_9FIRM|nr:DUF3795 domain-containing protein [Candidatus Merdivicinus excrementipullorum]